MERWGFAATIGAGFLSCCLLAWQGFEGIGADWVSGFLCVLWSLLMLARLMVLTAPNEVSQRPHLAQKIIFSLHEKHEDKRGNLLQQSFNTSFAVFIVLGFLLCVWQLVFSLYQNAPDAAMAGFLAENGYNSWVSAKVVFDWGQAFSYLLCLSMMGFLLRSYASDLAAVRPALLILTGYIAAGLILFAGMSKDGMMPESLSFVGHVAAQTSLLFDVLRNETGLLGIGLMFAMCVMPFAFIWLSKDKKQSDWVVLISGSVAFTGLIGSLFVSLNPALGGFIFLCAMGVFLAWGASERCAASLKI